MARTKKVKRTKRKVVQKKRSIKKDQVGKVVKKRGRPAGSKNKKKVKKDNPQEITWKTSKFLGYCPKRGCLALITSLDLDKKTIFICPKCKKRARVSKLISEDKVKRDGPKSKKEYLQGTVNTSFHDMPAMNDIAYDVRSVDE